MPGEHFTGIAVHVQRVAVLKKPASVANAHCGGNPAFASKSCCVLKNRALFHDESCDSREQRGEMWMKDAHNENRTCRDGHDIFGIPYHIRLPTRTPRRCAQARIDFR